MNSYDMCVLFIIPQVYTFAKPTLLRITFSFNQSLNVRTYNPKNSTVRQKKTFTVTRRILY